MMYNFTGQNCINVVNDRHNDEKGGQIVWMSWIVT
jgi:hypothetical protein